MHPHTGLQHGFLKEMVSELGHWSLHGQPSGERQQQTSPSQVPEGSCCGVQGHEDHPHQLLTMRRILQAGGLPCPFSAGALQRKPPCIQTLYFGQGRHNFYDQLPLLGTLVPFLAESEVLCTCEEQSELHTSL